VEIIEGLKAGETIVARGIQRVRNGIAVQPRPLSGPPAAGAAPNAARVPSAG
jgi:hypothetical protein